MKRLLALLVLATMLLTLLPCVAENAAGQDLKFIINHGDETSNRIAITVDDFWEVDKGWDLLELCRKYGVRFTLFPLGMKLDVKDREMWQALIDAGCEIGTHSFGHNLVGDQPAMTIISGLGRAQQRLDEVLGYHYQIHWFRPPYGNINDSNGNDTKARRAIKTYGFEHVVRWNVSQTDPELAVKEVKNGCIMLYHARNKDVKCLDTLIPQILEMGYEPVTLSEMFGMDPPETGGELFVFDKNNYRKTGK